MYFPLLDQNNILYHSILISEGTATTINVEQCPTPKSCTCPSDSPNRNSNSDNKAGHNFVLMIISALFIGATRM